MAATNDDIMGAIQQLADHFGTKLESVRMELKCDIASLDKKLSGDIAALDNKLSGNIATLDKKLSGNIASLDKNLSGEIEQLRHVTSANHFRVIGRIDQVASMLADHMADPHGPPPPNRKSA